MNDALIRLVLIVVAAITVVSGLTQLVAPASVLASSRATRVRSGLICLLPSACSW
jgi:hypothetical protein